MRILDSFVVIWPKKSYSLCCRFCLWNRIGVRWILPSKHFDVCTFSCIIIFATEKLSRIEVGMHPANSFAFLLFSLLSFSYTLFEFFLSFFLFCINVFIFRENLLYKWCIFFFHCWSGRTHGTIYVRQFYWKCCSRRFFFLTLFGSRLFHLVKNFHFFVKYLKHDDLRIIWILQWNA